MTCHSQLAPAAIVSRAAWHPRRTRHKGELGVYQTISEVCLLIQRLDTFLCHG